MDSPVSLESAPRRRSSWHTILYRNRALLILGAPCLRYFRKYFEKIMKINGLTSVLLRKQCRRRFFFCNICKKVDPLSGTNQTKSRPTPSKKGPRSGPFLHAVGRLFWGLCRSMGRLFCKWVDFCKSLVSPFVELAFRLAAILVTAKFSYKNQLTKTKVTQVAPLDHHFRLFFM